MLIEDAIYPDDQDKQVWLSGFLEQLKWIKGDSRINVEELFHLAGLQVERWKMHQQCSPVGRTFGPCTPHNKAEMIECILEAMTESLPRVIWREQQSSKCDLSPIKRFTDCLKPSDVVVSFNYDTLVERSLENSGKSWNHGLKDVDESPHGVTVLKLHGSVDWLLLKRGTGNSKRLTLLYSKKDSNADSGNEAPAEEVEFHWELWRINEERDVAAEMDRQDGLTRYISFPGMSTLGIRKQLALLPGSGLLWSGAEKELLDAEEIYVVGFSLAPFDAMTRMLFAAVMQERHTRNQLPTKLRLIDPNADDLVKDYRSVFHLPFTVIRSLSQDVDWTSLLG